MTVKRSVLYVDQTMYTPNGYVLVLVTECEAGFGRTAPESEPWYFGKDIQTAKRLCDEANAKMGFTPEQAQEIVSGSMRLQNEQQAGREASDERWERIRAGRS